MILLLLYLGQPVVAQYHHQNRHDDDDWRPPLRTQRVNDCIDVTRDTFAWRWTTDMPLILQHRQRCRKYSGLSHGGPALSGF